MVTVAIVVAHIMFRSAKMFFDCRGREGAGVLRRNAQFWYPRTRNFGWCLPNCPCLTSHFRVGWLWRPRVGATQPRRSIDLFLMACCWLRFHSHGQDAPHVQHGVHRVECAGWHRSPQGCRRVNVNVVTCFAGLRQKCAAAKTCVGSLVVCVCVGIGSQRVVASCTVLVRLALGEYRCFLGSQYLL